MKEIAVSKFKATCLAQLEEVRRTGQPLRVTRFGKPLAEIVPPAPPAPPSGWLGSLAGTGRILADIVSPASPESDWDALRK